MKTKTVQLLLPALLALLMVLPIYALQYEPEENFLYRLIDDGSTVEITEYTGDNLEVRIPSTIGGLPVTAIGEGAFAEGEWVEDNGYGQRRFYPSMPRLQITGVVIPDSVTRIGAAAFVGVCCCEGGGLLASVTIGNGVTYIGDFAFAGNRLTYTTIPPGVTHIGEGAFFYNQLTEVTIPEGVTHIGSYAFESNQLISVTISDGVTHIGADAFGDNRIVSINLPLSLTHIGAGAFIGNQLTGMTLPAGLTYIGSWAFSYNQLAELSIPDSVTYIGEGAFESNLLTRLIIPAGVTYVGAVAFANNRLTEVSVSAMTFLDSWVFHYNGPDGLTPATVIRRD